MDVSGFGKTVPDMRDRPGRDPALMDLARKLEASFLSEMLKHSGVGTPRTTFGGGSGETQFSSFLVAEYADAMARAGGIGLSESIYAALVRKETVA